MGVNKVNYYGDTVIDLTGDTVSPNALLKGVTAHDSSGEIITGTLEETNPEELYSHLSKTSQHNLIELTNESGTYTYSGVQYIVNREAGTVFVPEGQTVTDTVWINIASNYIENPGGRLTLSGCPDGGSNNTYSLSANLGEYIDTGSGESSTSAIFSVDLRIRSGTTIPEGGLLFHPMVRYSEDTDDSFYRGSKSNVQLSKELDILKDNTGKNKLTGTVTAFDNSGTVSYSDTDGWGYTNTVTSSEGRFIFIIQYFNSGTYVKSVSKKTIYQRFGLVEGEFEKDSSYDTIYFGHQGTPDLKVTIDVSDLPDGKYVLSINLLGNLPQSAGGLSWNQMMIRPAGSPRGFELPCMTNKEISNTIGHISYNTMPFLINADSWYATSSTTAVQLKSGGYNMTQETSNVNVGDIIYVPNDMSAATYNYRGELITEFTIQKGFYEIIKFLYYGTGYHNIVYSINSSGEPDNIYLKRLDSISLNVIFNNIYRKGTWTPTIRINNGTVTPTVIYAKWSRVGNTVNITARMTVDGSYTTPTVSISRLPVNNDAVDLLTVVVESNGTITSFNPEIDLSAISYTESRSYSGTTTISLTGCIIY